MIDEPEASSPEERATVPIRLVNFEETDPQFTTAMHVNSDQGLFQLVFSQFLPPVFLTPADAEPYVARGYAPAKVVARLLLTPQLATEIVTVLQTQLERQQEQAAEAAQAEQDDVDEG